MTDLLARRAFLRAAAAAGAAWATAEFAGIEAALAWARQQSAAMPDDRMGALKALTPAQADTIDAAAARIIPSIEGRPGAHEAGAVYFIDQSLATFNTAQKPLYVKGVNELDRRAGRVAGRKTAFASLRPGEQDVVLRSIEKGSFFQMLRVDTIFGTLALPAWGGNRDHSGWALLGMTHQPAYQPPFGYYDANVDRQG